MGKQTGFIEYKRCDPAKRSPCERIKDFNEFEMPLPVDLLRDQAARCMDCGIPSCHAFGCSLHNRIPDWNDMVSRGQWQKALQLLHSTINFPEFTGRLCPASCEAACTLSINQQAVTIRQIEFQIVEMGWQEGWIVPLPSIINLGRRVAVVGSGPAGLAAAQQLARLGYEVIVFERARRIGGLLRYGIPDFKLEKWLIDRRIEQLKAEGVIFETNVDAGVDLSVHYMQRSFAAVLLALGVSQPRDLKITGRELGGIYFALDFLIQQNRISTGEAINEKQMISAKGKRVVVIGGGDTGSDCVGTSIRQGATSVTQIELLAKPLQQRASSNPWPTWPGIYRSSSSHEEGCERLWSLSTVEFLGENGRVTGLRATDTSRGGKAADRFFAADMVLLAMGFEQVEHGLFVQEAGLKLNERGGILVDDHFMASVPGIFAAGDAVQGASLVAHAISAGRQAAAGIHLYLHSGSDLGATSLR